MWNGGWKKVRSFFYGDGKGEKKGGGGANGKRMVGMKRGVRM